MDVDHEFHALRVVRGRYAAVIAARVILDDAATSDELRSVRNALSEAGFVPLSIEATLERRGAGSFPSLIDVLVAIPLTAFFSSFASAAGKDAWATFKKLVTALGDARRTGRALEGSIVFRDDEGTNVVISASIPEEAIEKLRDVDWTQRRGHYLIWDPTRRAWRDPTRRA